MKSTGKEITHKRQKTEPGTRKIQQLTNRLGSPYYTHVICHVSVIIVTLAILTILSK